MDIVRYIQKKREKLDELVKQYPEGYCLVTSVDPFDTAKTGIICEVSLDNAARIITDGTHRLSAKEEVERYRRAQQSEFERIQSAEALRMRRNFTSLIGDMSAVAPVVDAAKGPRK